MPRVAMDLEHGITFPQQLQASPVQHETAWHAKQEMRQPMVVELACFALE